MSRCTCSTPTSFGRSSGRSWLRMGAHVMYLMPTSFGSAFTAVHGGAIARMSSAGHQCALGRLEPTYTSILRADRSPHVRHGLPRVARVAQAHDQRPLEDRTRLSSQTRRSVRRRPISGKADLQDISTPAPALNFLLLQSIFPFTRTASWICPRCRNRFASGRVSMSNGGVSAHVVGNSGGRNSAPPATAMHALSTPHGPIVRRGSSRCDFPRFLVLQAVIWRNASHTCPSRQAGALMPRTMTLRRSAIAPCSSGMDSTSTGIIFFGAELLAKSVQAALEAGATTDG